jgi:hypothetical protein
MNAASSAWAKGLARRLRSPALWAAFGALYLPYLAYTIWETRAMPRRPRCTNG